MKISYEKNCSGALVWQVATTITANDKKKWLKKTCSNKKII